MTRMLFSIALALPATAFAYDGVGNMQSNESKYDAANRIISNANYIFAHDENGNMKNRVRIKDGVYTIYSYNSENQLVNVVYNGEVIVTFKYDGLGRRIEKSVMRPGAAPKIKRYVYDGDHILAILDGDNKTLATFTYGPGIDEALEIDMPQEKRFYCIHHDGQNSVIALSDEKANVVERIEYSAFGIPYFSDVRGSVPVVSDRSFTLSPFAFTGREWDPEIQLYYYRARYYDPYLGRFIQPDPIGFHGGDTNLYAYVGNNPVLRIDPFGTGPTKPPDQWAWSKDSLRAKLGIKMYDMTYRLAFDVVFHYFYDPYHDYFQKPVWSYDAASILLSYPYTWTPAFPMFLPLNMVKKKPVECRVD
jgi:RHS repeat-associated protein